MHTKETLESMTIVELTGVYNSLTGKSLKKVKGSKEKIIAEILSLQKPVAAATGAKRGRRPTGDSIKDALRQMFAPGREFTREDLERAFPDRTWASVRSMISDLKNEKYANGPLVHIDRDKDTGKFRRVA